AWCAVDHLVGDAVDGGGLGGDRGAGVHQGVQAGVSGGGVDDRDLDDLAVEVGGFGVEDHGRVGARPVLGTCSAPDASDLVHGAVPVLVAGRVMRVPRSPRRWGAKPWRLYQWATRRLTAHRRSGASVWARIAVRSWSPSPWPRGVAATEHKVRCSLWRGSRRR